MTKKQIWINIISFSILPVAILSVIPFPSPLTDIITNLQITPLWWAVQSLTLLVLLYSSRAFFDINNTNNLRVLLLYLLWNIFCCIRGTFVADSYWVWKGLIGNSMLLFLPILAYTATNKVIVQSMMSYYIKYTLPLFAIFVLIVSTDAFGFFLIPISFLMLFFPVLTTRWRVLLGTVTLFVLLVDLDARSNVIKFTVPILLLSVYYLRKYILVKWMETVRLILIILPFMFFALAVSGVFNVFKMDTYIEGTFKEVKRDKAGNMVEYDLKTDTRTFLYMEVLYSAKKYNSWWVGRSPARGNLSEAFGDEDMTGRGERLTNEAAILNVFTWTGIIGLIFYFFVFYKASHIAINHSNNIFSKMLGLMIAFRWLYSWVEDVNDFSLSYFMLWIMIGLCFSKSFRVMNNKEVTLWARGIFNKQQRLATQKASKEKESETEEPVLELINNMPSARNN